MEGNNIFIFRYTVSLLIFLIYAVCSVRYYLFLDFRAYTFDELLLFLSLPIGGIPFEIIFRAFCFIVICPAILTVLTILFFNLIAKKTHLKQNSKVLISLCLISLFILVASAEIFYISFSQEKDKNTTFSNNEIFIPTKDSIYFPFYKRNLIVIFLESFEESFKNEKIYGASLLKPLEKCEQKGFSFKNYQESFGMSPSTPSLIAFYTGLPVATSLSYKKRAPYTNYYTFGKVLADAGYYNVALLACQENYANGKELLEKYGMHQIIGMETIEQMYPQIKQKTDWGYADSDLFQIAEDQILRLKSNQPFFLLIQTMDTHANYHPPVDIKKRFSSKSYDVIWNTAEQTAHFIEWVEKQKIGKNTTIVILGDHLRKGLDIDYPENRSIYNLFINTPFYPHNTNRTFNTADLFPTILEMLGAKVKNHRLGVGTSLFSDLQTLSEQYKKEELNSYLKNYISQIILDNEQKMK